MALLHGSDSQFIQKDQIALLHRREKDQMALLHRRIRLPSYTEDQMALLH